MFTGIIQKCGILRDRRAVGGITRIAVDAGIEFDDIKIGDSVSVNGVCLSAINNMNGNMEFELMKETRDDTMLSIIKIGKKVNLEKAISASERFSGHFVTGHVDYTGKVIKRIESYAGTEINIELPEAFAQLFVAKGSVAVDGVSLTVSDVGENTFSVSLIPLTVNITNLNELKKGDRVNIETDIIGKYVKNIIKSDMKRGAPLNEEFLKKYGYVDPAPL